jgi:hypothetical protein
LIKQELLLEHSQIHSNYLGTSLEATERIHQLERICLITVRKGGFKVLKSKHFPAKYIHCVATPVAADLPTDSTSPPSDTTTDTADSPATPASANPAATITAAAAAAPSATSAVATPSKKPSEGEMAVSTTETKEESSQEQFDFTLDSSDSSTLEKFHLEVVQWFPELEF